MLNIRFKNVEAVQKFATTAESYKSDILIHDGKTTVDGSSIMGVLFLGLHKTFQLEFIKKDPDEYEQFLHDIAELNILEE